MCVRDTTWQPSPETTAVLVKVSLLPCKTSKDQQTPNTISCSRSASLVAASRWCTKRGSICDPITFNAICHGHVRAVWGVIRDYLQIPGSLYLEDMELHINVLGLRAIRLVCSILFCPVILKSVDANKQYVSDARHRQARGLLLFPTSAGIESSCGDGINCMA